MIKLTENIWIGDSYDERHADLATEEIDAVLNVAHDLDSSRGWSQGVEYMQVGLVDGPGNPLAAYHAAILALDTLLRRHKQALVCCHSGGRSISVVLMYLNATARRDWDGWIDLLHERIEIELPVPHEAHRRAFDEIDWRRLYKILGD